MILLYGIPTCATVKKARTWLDARGVDYQFYDYKKQGISRSKLEAWLSQVPWEKLVNRAGTTWRKLPDAEKSRITGPDTAARLMQQSTSIIKRPLLESSGGQVLGLGFSETEYARLFA